MMEILQVSSSADSRGIHKSLLVPNRNPRLEGKRISCGIDGDRLGFSILFLKE